MLCQLAQADQADQADSFGRRDRPVESAICGSIGSIGARRVRALGVRTDTFDALIAAGPVGILVSTGAGICIRDRNTLHIHRERGLAQVSVSSSPYYGATRVAGVATI